MDIPVLSSNIYPKRKVIEWNIEDIADGNKYKRIKNIKEYYQFSQ
jgi:hypothetical protein